VCHNGNEANFLTAMFAEVRKGEGRGYGLIGQEDKGGGRGKICQIYADVLYG